MGRDFNPRAWRITRAQCEVLAGRRRRSRDHALVPGHHAGLCRRPAGRGCRPIRTQRWQGRRVGVLVGVSGLDRVALAAWLRAAKAQVTVTPRCDGTGAGSQGRPVRRWRHRTLAGDGTGGAQQGWTVGWMPADLDRYPVVLGLWKGDLTLKRAIVVRACPGAAQRRDGNDRCAIYPRTRVRLQSDQKATICRMATSAGASSRATAPVTTSSAKQTPCNRAGHGAARRACAAGLPPADAALSAAATAAD